MALQSLVTLVTAGLWHFLTRVALRRSEGAATTTRAHGIGILDIEPAPHEAIDVIDASAAYIEKGDGIDEYLETVLLVHLIVFTGVVVKGHTILHAAATAALHKNSQAVRFIQTFLRDDFL